jgi:hypothetical protein
VESVIRTQKVTKSDGTEYYYRYFTIRYRDFRQEEFAEQEQRLEKVGQSGALDLVMSALKEDPLVDKIIRALQEKIDSGEIIIAQGAEQKITGDKNAILGFLRGEGNAEPI